MTQEKKLDRKDFLTSAVAAWAVVSLGACSDEGDGGGTDDGGGGATGGSATGGSATGGSATGGSATGGSSMLTGGSSTGGSATGGSGGGRMYVCTVSRMPVSSGTEHTHPLMIPGSDIDRGYQDAPYPLEDGGTGHTHTLEFAPYEWAFLAGGSEIDSPTSEDAGHFHTVWTTCVLN